MTCAEARSFAERFLPLIQGLPQDRTIVLAPPFTALQTLSEALAGSPVALSSQNVHWEGHGAYTGEISPAMLLEHGVRYAIVGHSERRTLHGARLHSSPRRRRCLQCIGRHEIGAAAL